MNYSIIIKIHWCSSCHLHVCIIIIMNHIMNGFDWWMITLVYKIKKTNNSERTKYDFFCEIAHWFPNWISFFFLHPFFMILGDENPKIAHFSTFKLVGCQCWTWCANRTTFWKQCLSFIFTYLNQSKNLGQSYHLRYSWISVRSPT